MRATSAVTHVPANRAWPDLLAPFMLYVALIHEDSIRSASSVAEGNAARNIVVELTAPVSRRRRMKAWLLGCVTIRYTRPTEEEKRVPSESSCAQPSLLISSHVQASENCAAHDCRLPITHNLLKLDGGYLRRVDCKRGRKRGC